jgi:hypothetical protein
MATIPLLPLATRTTATPVADSPVRDTPTFVTAFFGLTGQGWSGADNVVRLEVWESPDQTGPFHQSYGGDFDGTYTPKPGNPSVQGPRFTPENLLFPTAQFPGARIFGRCFVKAGTVTFQLDLTTT